MQMLPFANSKPKPVIGINLDSGSIQPMLRARSDPTGKVLNTPRQSFITLVGIIVFYFLFSISHCTVEFRESKLFRHDIGNLDRMGGTVSSI